MLHYLYVICISLKFSSGLDIFGSSCVTPPLLCPNENITFWLYTRKTADTPTEIKTKDIESIRSAPWVKNAPIKILIHGYTGHRDFSPNTEIRPAYFDCCDYNIISIDYNPLALEPCYIQAAANTELVGMCTALLIDELVNEGFRLEDIHVIGFSLGGQAAGFIANYIQSGQIVRITALDPALPLFVTLDKDKKIDASDAKFVDVLHTNSLQKGKLERSGHLDIFANNGVDQPGCSSTENQTESACSHSRAPLYYAESITTKTGFYASKCYSWFTYILGLCHLIGTEDEILVGEYVSKNESGVYFFSTNSESPYARGPSNSSNYSDVYDDSYENNSLISSLSTSLFG
ncbi:unnamed protein product [Pieris macdunnoughi]|uniref:Lipase domain-containing protein n=1 Tax=Pieris macdunnoughi TaxID=345717 RepID=A0A821SQR1_9NEOP|nr:unnamed protein product [Pieris macdunnoughi]